MESRQKGLQRKKQQVRNLINLFLVIAGLVVVFVFMSFMQQEYSVRRVNQSAEVALSTVVDTLDANTKKVESLRSRYHTDNQAVLDDISILLEGRQGEEMLTATASERSASFERLSRVVGSSGYLLVTDRTGRVVVAPRESDIGVNLVNNGTLTPEQLQVLVRNEQQSVRLQLQGTRRIETGRNGKKTVRYEEIIGSIPGENVTAYFYSMPVGDYFLIYAVDVNELEKQLTALRELGPVLSGVVVGNDGFVFAVNAETGCFMYFDDGNVRLDGQPIADSGLTQNVLKNRYSGLQTIGGVTYQCLSRRYTSPFYGEYIVITAVSAAESVFEGDKTAIALSEATFAVCALILLLYAFFLRKDPDQLVQYDEEVFSFREAREARRTDHTRSFRNIRLFTIRGEQVYLKAGIAGRLIPVLLVSAILVFIVSWNSQTMVEISKGIEQSDTAIRQMEVMFSNRENSSEIIMERYQGQYMSKLGLISFMLEEDESLTDLLNSDADNVHVHLDDDLKPVLDDDGRPVRSVANMQALQTLAEANGFEYLGIYDDQGRTMAVNDDMWYFVLSRDREQQSSQFLDVITGKKDRLIQDIREDERGREMQYMGCVYHYYTLSGEGPEAGHMVSAKEYDEYIRSGSFQFNGEAYTVRKHRGMVEGGITDATITEIMDSTTNQSLMKQVKVGSDGFPILFDNSSEHVCLWSPFAAAVGRPAEELNVTPAAFSGTFKGFTTLSGTKYFQMYVFNNGYWIATAIPMAYMLAGRTPIALITTLVTIVFYLLLYFLCIFSTQSEEEAMEIFLDKRISSRAEDEAMVRVMMPSGKIKYVRSASARYSESNVPWYSMTATQQITLVMKIALSLIILCAMVSGFFADQIYGPESAIAYIMHGDWEHSLNYFAVIAFTGMVLGVSAASFIISAIINFIIRNMGARVETVGRLLLSVLKYGSVLFSIFYGFSLLGFSTSGLVTSASIMSVVIGLGSQNLISDILSGVFIVFEGAFRVGDIVTVGDFRGSVVDIGMRTTKIENTTGDIKIFTNSSIAGIINMTKKDSKAMCDIGIEYSADLKHVERVLNDALPGIGQKNTQIIGRPVYMGVVSLSESAVVLRVAAQCSEKNRILVSWYLNRELLLLFQRNGITVPFPQMTVSHLKEKDKQEKS